MVSGYGSLNGSGPQQVWTSNTRTSQSTTNNTSTFSYEVRYYGNGYGSWGNSGSWSFTTPHFYTDGTFSIPQSDAFKTYTVLRTGSYTVSHNSSGVLAAFNVRGAIAYNHSTIGTGEVNLTEPAPPNITRVPATPAVPTLTEPTPVGMRVTWVAPASNGSAITAYDVQWSPNADMTGGTIVTVGNVLTTVLTGMPPQKLHYVRVRAVNARGASTYSGTKSLSTLPAGPPVLVVASSPSGSQATLTFAPPGGVTGVTKYVWERRATGTTTPVATGESTEISVVVTNLVPGNSYDWRAIAHIGTYVTTASEWLTLKQAKPNTNAGDYFDGSSTDSADIDYSWTGTADRTTSLATAQGVAGWDVPSTAGGSIVMYRVTAGIFSAFAARVQVNVDTTGAGMRAGQENSSSYRTEVTAGATYVGSLHVRPSRSQRLAAEISYYNAANAVINPRVLGAATVVPGETWARIVTGGIAPTDATWAVVRVIDVTGDGWSKWLAGDTMDLDGGMISLNEEFPYFDGDTLSDGTYLYDWTDAPNASVSTRTPVGTEAGAYMPELGGLFLPSALAITDPDCAPVPTPPRPPSVPSDCIENVGVWRRYYTEIPADLVPDWMDVVPTLDITTGSKAARQVRIRYYPNPDGLIPTEVDTSSWISEQIISYMPARTLLIIDGVTQHVWAEVNGSDPISADHLLYGTNGKPATWPVLSCGIAYLVSVDVPIAEPAGNVVIEASLTART
jgi:hypothetical protein